jgi:hypothetical protein
MSNATIPMLPQAISITGAEQLEAVQAGTSVRLTALQISGLSVLNGTVTQQGVGQLLYPQTTAEIQAGVVPTAYFYPPGDARRYGALLNGIADDTAAINTACLVGSGTVGTIASGIAYLAPGTAKISAPITMNTNGITLQGAGEGATKILLSNATQNGIVIGNGTNNPNNIYATGFSMASSGTQTAGSAVLIQNGHNCGVSHLRFTGMFWSIDLEGGASQFLYFVSYIEITSGIANGIVIGNISLVQDVWIDHCAIASCSNDGILLLNVSGFYFNQIDSLTCGYGLATFPAAGQQVTGGWCNTVICDTCVNNGWHLLTNGGKVTDLSLVNCWGSSNGTGGGGTNLNNGFVCNQGTGQINGVTLNDFMAVNNQGAGAYLVAGSNISILNSKVYTNSQLGSAVRSGIEVAGNFAGFKILNTDSGAGGPFTPNLQAYGLTIAAGCLNYVVANNNLAGNVTGALLNSATIGTNSRVYGNIGYINATRFSAQVPNGQGLAGVAVNHGLSVAPGQADVLLQPTVNVSSVGVAQYWVSAVSATQITINTNANTTNALFFAVDIRTAGAQF